MSATYSITGFIIIVLGLFLQWQVYVSRIVFTFAASSIVIAVWFAYQGIVTDSYSPIVLAVLTAGVRGTLIPILIVRNLHVTPWRARENNPVMGTASSIVLSLVLVIFSLWLFGWSIGRYVGATGVYAALPFAMLFQGAFLIISRRNAFIQMVGYLELENGVLLLGAWGFPQLPLLIEAAIVLDLLGVVVVARIIMRMREESLSIDDRAVAEAALSEDMRG